MNLISEKQISDLDKIKQDNQEFIAYMQSLAEQILKTHPHAFDHNPLPK